VFGDVQVTGYGNLKKEVLIKDIFKVLIAK
jgi:hypothetical protein